jgi:hypothetical protein
LWGPDKNIYLATIQNHHVADALVPSIPSPCESIHTHDEIEDLGDIDLSVVYVGPAVKVRFFRTKAIKELKTDLEM